MEDHLARENKAVREMFQEYYTAHYHPSLKILAKVIGTSYPNLVSWRKEKYDYGEIHLAKVRKFVESQN